MIPGTSDVNELVDMIWSSTLGLHVEPLDQADRSDWVLPPVEAHVHIAGSWRGAVVLHTSQPLATLVAQRMFDLGAATPTADEIQDAFGEIANMTGGNIKGLLSEGDAYLSLPLVVSGKDYSIRVPRSREVVRAEFLCEGQPLVVTVLQGEAPATGTASERRTDFARRF